MNNKGFPMWESLSFYVIVVECLESGKISDSLTLSAMSQEMSQKCPESIMVNIAHEQKN